MKKNSILTGDPDRKKPTIRDIVAGTLSSNMYAFVMTLSDELKGQGLEPVSREEFIVAIGWVLRMLD